MLRHTLILPALVGAVAHLSGSVCGAQSSTGSAPTVVIVVRHAEKAGMPANDPPLTVAGAARAQALAAALADAHVTAILSTPTRRTRETARPLAEARHVAIETVPAGAGVLQYRTIADVVRAHAGQTVLVVGHSNTVGGIIAALGGPRMPPLCDSEYSWFFTLVLDEAGARLVRGTYGAPSPDPPRGCGGMQP